jgi:hypothetical protein
MTITQTDCTPYEVYACIPTTVTVPDMTTTTVTAPSTTTTVPRDGGLPLTGGDVFSLVVIAVILIVTGVVLYLRNRP